MTASVLAVEGLVKHFPVGHGRAVKAVNGVSFHIARGEALALVGESGSGKTTVGRCVLRLIEPTAGAIAFRGEDILAMAPEQFRARRRHIQLVFQEPYDSLNPRMRIGKVLDEPLMLAGAGAPSARRSRVHDLLDMVGLGRSFADLYPHQLSGGEQQRVGIARAIATDPELVVLDEPTSALDVSVRAEILDLLLDLQERLGFAYLFISHDLTAVRRVCQRVAVMYLGRIVETGRTEDIFERPLHPYSRALLSSVLYPDPRKERERFVLTGEIPSPIDLPSGCALHARCPWARPECDLSAPALEPLLPGRYVACFRAREENGIGPP
ncbi:MAG TPA: ABC transporter ATP-binding protein [Candidatus Methylomirabilis sp.]|nr:ABC transporter ATP-binding protein [Candidatus Methylomirabilis sp.]